MPANHSLNSLSPTQALRFTRIIWAVLILSQLAFAAITIVRINRGSPNIAPELHPLLFYISAALLFVVLLIAVFARSQIYKAHWHGHTITPKGYTLGNLVMLAMLEGAGMSAITASLVTGVIYPTMLLTAAALAVQLVNFPNGRAMQPAPPPFVTTYDFQP